MNVVGLPILVWAVACSCFGWGTSAPEQGVLDPVPEKSPKPRRGKSGGGREERTAPSHPAFVRAAQPCAARVADGTFEVAFDWKGASTKAVLYVPMGPGPHPLVVLLHAGDASPDRILTQTRMDAKAKLEGFALLVPWAADTGGHGLHWNSGKFSAVIDPEGMRDDVAYLDALSASVRTDVCADQVFAAGFSSGGQMVHRWACQSRQPLGILSAAGELLVPRSSCVGPRAVRGYVGTADKVFSGPPLAGSDQPSAPETVEIWSKINRCSSNQPPLESRVGDTVCKVWQGCAASTELCVIDNFPHAWPAPWNKDGATQTNATDAGWQWMKSIR